MHMFEIELPADCSHNEGIAEGQADRPLHMQNRSEDSSHPVMIITSVAKPLPPATAMQKLGSDDANNIGRESYELQ